MEPPSSFRAPAQARTPHPVFPLTAREPRRRGSRPPQPSTQPLEQRQDSRRAGSGTFGPEIIPTFGVGYDHRAALTLTPKTTIHTLLKEYPFLLDYLAEYHPEFKKLTNPVLRRTVGRMATLDTVAEQGNVPLNVLIEDIADEVERKTGARPPIADVADAETIDPARLAELHAIVKDLHAGKTVEEVKPRFEELIQDVEATEIAAMEQKLIEGGVPDTEVKRLCDVHVQVFAEALEGHEAVKAPAGHPLDTFQRENQALLQVTASLRKVAEAIGEPPDGAAWARLKGALADTVERLADVDRHYLRKENQLFPFLESTAWRVRARSCGPSTMISAR